MRHELREYFDQARRVREVNDDATLIESMSPLLQGTVAFAANRLWLRKIWWLNFLGESRDAREFIASLAKALQVRAFVASERPPLGQLYVLRKGMCIKNWHFLRTGRVWGDDMIVDDSRLMDHSQAVALTYIEVFALSREAVLGSTQLFPKVGQLVQKAARRIRLQRLLLMQVCKITKRQPRSFVPKYLASGYSTVGPQMSTEEKVSAMHAAIVPTRNDQLQCDTFSASSAACTMNSALTMDERGHVTGTVAPTASFEHATPAPSSSEAKLEHLQSSVHELSDVLSRFTTTMLVRLDELTDSKAAAAKAKLARKKQRQANAASPPPLPHSLAAMSPGCLAGTCTATHFADEGDLAPLSSAEKSRPDALCRAPTMNTNVLAAGTLHNIELDA